MVCCVLLRLRLFQVSLRPPTRVGSLQLQSVPLGSQFLDGTVPTTASRPPQISSGLRAIPHRKGGFQASPDLQHLEGKDKRGHFRLSTHTPCKEGTGRRFQARKTRLHPVHGGNEESLASISQTPQIKQKLLVFILPAQVEVLEGLPGPFGSPGNSNPLITAFHTPTQVQIPRASHGPPCSRVPQLLPSMHLFCLPGGLRRQPGRGGTCPSWDPRIQGCSPEMDTGGSWKCTSH